MNIRTKKFYVGSHKGTTRDGYTGSGTLFSLKYDAEPHNFKRRILQYVIGDLDYIREIEGRWLSLIKDEELHGVKYYNRTKEVKFGAYGSLNTRWITNGAELRKIYPDQELPEGWRYGQSDAKIAQLRAFRHTEETKESIRQTLTGVAHTTERVEKMRASKLINESRWYTNGVDENLFSKNDTVPDGWYPGRCDEQKAFMRTVCAANTGKICITNGTNEKMVDPNQEIPDGWYRGRSDTTKVLLKNNKGTSDRFVISNGTDEKFIFEGDPIPGGWSRGRTGSSVRGKMIINNGIEQTYILRVNPIPDGWKQGRLPKDHK